MEDKPKDKPSLDSLPRLGKSTLEETLPNPNSSEEDHLVVKRKASSWNPINGTIDTWPRVNIYICKRPFDDEVLVKEFKYIMNFLLTSEDIEYHVYLEETIKYHSVVVVHHDSSRLHYFTEKILDEYNIHFVFTLGGDGTILWAHKMFNKLSLPPFLCFNGGTLCFLSNFNINHSDKVMDFFHERVKSKGKFRYKMFPRLNSYVCGADKCERFKRYMLNDVVVERTTPNIINLEIYINDCFAVKVKSDGLLVSSSTGSTAYNLSLANGVIMHSDVESIIINPMASMSLSSRPIVVPKTFKVKVVFSLDSRQDSRLVYDGLVSCNFTKGDYLVVESCPEGLPMILEDDYEETKTWIYKLKELRGWK